MCADEVLQRRHFKQSLQQTISTLFSKLFIQRKLFTAKNQTLQSYQCIYFSNWVGIISTYSNGIFGKL